MIESGIVIHQFLKFSTFCMLHGQLQASNPCFQIQYLSLIHIYLLVHLSKYIQQMLEKYTVLQSDLSYTLDRLLSNILTGEIKNDNSLTPRFAKFR